MVAVQAESNQAILLVTLIGGGVVVRRVGGGDVTSSLLPVGKRLTFLGLFFLFFLLLKLFKAIAVGVGELCAGVPQQHVHDDDLTPGIALDQLAAYFAVVAVNELDLIGADFHVGDSSSTNHLGALVAQQQVE